MLRMVDEFGYFICERCKQRAQYPHYVNGKKYCNRCWHDRPRSSRKKKHKPGVIYCPWCDSEQPLRPEVNKNWKHIRCKSCNMDIKEVYYV